jgi:DNA-binding transcriptional MerR regulator
VVIINHKDIKYNYIKPDEKKLDKQSIGYAQYEARHVERILGVSKHKILFWKKSYSLVNPDVEQGVGTGNRNIYSKTNLLELAIIKELVSFGIDLNTIKCIKNLIDHEKIVSWEKDGKTYNKEPEGPGEAKKKLLNYYDWAFRGSFDVGINLFLDDKRGGKGFMIQQWEWIDRPATEEDQKNLFGHKSLVYLNVSLIAREIQEKLDQG